MACWPASLPRSPLTRCGWLWDELQETWNRFLFPVGSLFALPGGFAWHQKVASAAWVYAGMCLLRECRPKIQAGSLCLLLRGSGCPGRVGKSACSSRLLPSSLAEKGTSDQERSEKILEATTYLDVRRPAYEPPAPPAPMEPLYDLGPEGKVRGTAPHSAWSRAGGGLAPLIPA